MVIGRFKNKTYFKDMNNNRACIIQQIDGSARLLINNAQGKEILNKLYYNRSGALKAWSSFENGYFNDLTI